MIRAVLFDFAGTLVAGSLDIPGARRSAVRLLRARGLAVSLSRYDESVEDVLDELRPFRRMGFEVPYRSFQARVLTNLDLPYDSRLLNALERTDYRSYDWKLRRGARPALRMLHSRYALGVVSNGMSGAVYQVLTAAHLIHLFDSVTLAGEVGYRKPRREIFIAAATGLKILPEEAVFVGDSFAQDVLGAKEVGMKTIWLGKESPPEGADAVAKCLSEVPAIVHGILDGKSRPVVCEVE